MSREEIFFDAITSIREELVEEAQQYVFHRKRTLWRRYAGMAACLVLIAAVGFGVYGLANIRMGNGMIATDPGGAANQYTGSAGADEAVPSPEDAPAEGGAPGYAPPAGSGADAGPDSTDSARPPVSAERPGPSFTGAVLEVHETYLLVSGQEEARIRVPTEGLEDLPELREGDVVTVVCAEILEEDGGAVASGVEDIRLAEPDAP